MAELKIDGRMKVKSLKANFKTAFGATLRVYNGVQFAKDDATLASITDPKAPGSGMPTVGGNTHVGNFEKMMLDTFGIKVQVANADDSALADNNVTLCQAGK